MNIQDKTQPKKDGESDSAENAPEQSYARLKPWDTVRKNFLAGKKHLPRRTLQ